MVAQFCEGETISPMIYENFIETNLGSPLKELVSRSIVMSKVSSEIACGIAFDWFHVTKSFALTTISGIGTLAKSFSDHDEIPNECLIMLQTLLSIISDDIANKEPIFQKYAPKGAQGIHFVWWKETILNKLSAVSSSSKQLSGSAKILIAGMQQITQKKYGAAIQILVVESIARKICLAFLQIFSKTYENKKRIFKDDKDLAWIIAHIHAEEIHHQKVLDPNSGMLNLVQDEESHPNILNLLNQYVLSWKHLIHDFTLKIS